MNPRTYLAISGVLFGIVAVFHLLRVVNSWQWTLGPWSVPMYVSWVGAIGPGILCVWAARLSARLRRE